MPQKSRNRGVQATVPGVEILEAKRISGDLSRQALANRAGVSLDTVERLIKREKVDRESVRKIVYVLDLQPTDIIDRDEWEGVIKTSQSSKAAFDTSILISYYDANFDTVQQLYNQLQASGQTVSMVGQDIRQHKNWFQQFTQALKQWDCYVLLLSPQAALSEMLTEEVRQVREHYNAYHRPKILPIQIGQAISIQSDLCDYLVGLKIVELRSPPDLPAIVKAIQKQLTSPEINELSVDEDSSEPILPNTPPLESELPVGQVRLDSPFYVERPPIEAQCYQEIVHPGALIRVKAPRQMGKTSLMARILHHAREQGYRTAHLSFQLATSQVLSNIDKLMQWFCLSVGQGLHLPNQLADYWDDIFDGNYNSTVYFESYLLAETASPLVIGLDEVDRVFTYPEIANDFFGLLRAWYEKAKYGDRDSITWEKLRLIVIHSTEVYIPMNLNQSPFNVGLSVELPEFTQPQVQDLAQRYQLHWTSTQIEKLMQLVGGHPYLVRIAMYHVTHQAITLDQLLEQSTSELGIYSDHLRRHLWNLSQHPELAIAFRDVVRANTPVPLKPILAFKLHSMGLVAIAGNYVEPRCDLYRQYFCNRLDH